MTRQSKAAEPRDRYDVALLAAQVQETQAIINGARRSRRFVQRWAKAYHDGAIDPLCAKPRGGSKLR